MKTRKPVFIIIIIIFVGYVIFELLIHKDTLLFSLRRDSINDDYRIENYITVDNQNTQTFKDSNNMTIKNIGLILDITNEYFTEIKQLDDSVDVVELYQDAFTKLMSLELSEDYSKLKDQALSFIVEHSKNFIVKISDKDEINEFNIDMDKKYQSMLDEILYICNEKNITVTYDEDNNTLYYKE
ncbi:hypothetical protein [Vallitalea guaymasensis]|uniref:Uncharacterized protein n=1 Tax=Vallitalea guaymasensis TaxID=1185412 RepID=A0A8J8SAU4_9FIRM|nr:hypothetical protein [Vallitalea guaymasensis]QUH28073.1 hypothetical protein HYG85_03745 [Vallitalea guaymasensis]